MYTFGHSRDGATAIVNGIHDYQPLPPFLTLSGRLSLWNFMYSSQGHLASLECNSYPQKSVLIGGIRQYLVAFAI